MSYKIEDQEFIRVVKESFSIAEVLRKLNLCTTGGAYKHFYKRCRDLQVDHSHFTGKVWNKGKSFPKKKLDAKEWLIENCPNVMNSRTKRRLLDEGYLDEKCYTCGLGPTWNDKALVLHLDHINGDPFDNRIENLRILCPNCHSQTDTYAGKNAKLLDNSEPRKTKSFSAHQPRERQILHCEMCGKERSKNVRKSSKYCWECYSTHRRELQDRPPPKTKILWPERDKLLEMLSDKSFVQVGKILGVSDNAIRKHLKNCKN